MAPQRTLVAEPVNAIEAVRNAWNYPVFDAIFQRRARRFPLGATMPGDLAPFTSTKEPVPLDEIEEAMLVMAGTGISGMNLADLPYNEKEGSNFCGNTMLQFTGRVYASACGSHGTELFWTNDEGTYMVQFRDKTATAVQEFETQDDREKIVQTFRANTVQIGNGRLPVPMVPGVTQPFNWWNVNQPGSTLFMPVSDVTWEYINVLMLIMDEPNSYYPYDDLNGNAEPLKEWADKGYLDRDRGYALSGLENAMQMIVPGTEQSIMLQNMYLALQAMGLGGWIFTSSVAQYVLPMMGFRGARSGQRWPDQDAQRPAPHRHGRPRRPLPGVLPAVLPGHVGRGAGDLRREVGPKGHLQGRGWASRDEGPSVARPPRQQDAGLVPRSDEGVLRVHLGDLRPLPGDDRPDVDEHLVPGAPPGDGLLRPVLPARRLPPGRPRSHGGLALRGLVRSSVL